jgi:hypothetical protein
MIIDKFIDLGNIEELFEPFDKYVLGESQQKEDKNQLFSKEYPSFFLVNNILHELLNKDLDENTYFEFSRSILKNKNIINIMKTNYIDTLKKYYLKCKHERYLENLNEKKLITIYRQILRPYNYVIKAFEKYNNSKKYLLYIIEKKKDLSLKKVNSLMTFD